MDVGQQEHGQEDNMTINNKELLINNNSLNNYVSLRRGGNHVPKHMKNTNHYRNSAHIPVYNNYIPFPAPTISKPAPSPKVWSKFYSYVLLVQKLLIACCNTLLYYSILYRFKSKS